MSLADIKAKISAEAQARIKSLEAENDARIADVNRQADREINAAR